MTQISQYTICQTTAMTIGSLEKYLIHASAYKEDGGRADMSVFKLPIVETKMVAA